MQALIVHCHPEPRSFNGALTDIAVEILKARGHAVEVSDLYAAGFDPVERPGHYRTRAACDTFAPLNEQRASYEHDRLPAEVAREIDRLDRADLVIFQFPLWWHAQPAMLKGWFDRVFVYGGLYTSRVRYDRGYFRGKRAICSVTTDAPAPTFTRHGRSGDIVSLLWPINRSLYYVGFDVLAPQVTYGVQGGGLQYQAEQHFAAHLARAKTEWAHRLTGIEDDDAIAFAGWDDWNDSGAIRADSPYAWRR